MSTVLLDRNRHTADPLADSVLNLALAGLFLFGALVLGRAALAVSSGGGAMWLFPGLLAFLAAGFGFISVWNYFGREVLEIDETAVHATRYLGRFQRRWTVRLDEITSVEVPALGREFIKGSWGIGMPSLHLRTPSKT